jgi:hypothetical protein
MVPGEIQPIANQAENFEEYASAHHSISSFFTDGKIFFVSKKIMI